MPFEFIQSPSPPLLSPLVQTKYTSPLGDGLVIASPEGILLVELPGRTDASHELLKGTAVTDGTSNISTASASTAEHSMLTAARTHLLIASQWLEAYFDTPRELPQVPSMRPRGTPFQQVVWRAILDIPLGLTATYGELSAAIDRPRASRAVGAACGANPLPLLIPCHRVVGSKGNLTGFGGGLEQKQWLLDHEGVI